MPIHDWTRVTAGTWHAFHLSWIAEIQLCAQRRAAAAKLLCPGRADCRADGAGCAHLAVGGACAGARDGNLQGGGLAVATSPPRTRLVAESELSEYLPPNAGRS